MLLKTIVLKKIKIIHIFGLLSNSNGGISPATHVPLTASQICVLSIWDLRDLRKLGIFDLIREILGNQASLEHEL